MLGNWQLTNTTYSISILKHCSKASHVLILVWQEEIYSEVMIVANTHVPGSERPTSQTQSRIWKGAHNRKRFQTHVHRVDDAIQPSHPLSSPSLPAFNLSQHQGLFQ